MLLVKTQAKEKVQVTHAAWSMYDLAEGPRHSNMSTLGVEINWEVEKRNNLEKAQRLRSTEIPCSSFFLWI